MTVRLRTDSEHSWEFNSLLKLENAVSALPGPGALAGCLGVRRSRQLASETSPPIPRLGSGQALSFQLELH